ncbi:hypothetical protein JKP88DRAFT_242676 [Tribonema minus]|uniref:UmuC domain-containing protein n=1 Tax=Tribonema minus TaxID=303371 RepID=A0A835ZFL7_9STRA|nr:hypothetical protein JKP88DRAFT_242676 [Tribonema minus]
MVVIPVVLHLDLDAFFIQVERHRLPTLRAPTPCALQQHQDIIAVSYEARALGVAKHMRPAEVRRRFPDVRLVHVATVGDSGKVTYRAYRQASKNIFTLVASHCATLEKARSVKCHYVEVEVEAALQDHLHAGREPLRDAREGQVSKTPLKLKLKQHSRNIFTLVASHCAALEKASIDEAFLGPSLDDLAPHLPPATRAAAAAAACAAADAPPHHEVDTPSPWSEGLRNQLLEAGGALAREIQAALSEQLQYECSIGVAENKLLARLAVRSAKPRGVHVLRPAAVSALLAATPFTRLQGYGAGSAAARAVAALGAIHLADLARLGAAALARAEGVGAAAAAALAAAGAGVDGSAVAPRPPPASIQSQPSVHEVDTSSGRRRRPSTHMYGGWRTTSLTPKPVAALCLGRPQDMLQPIGAHETERLRYHMAVLAADVLERAEFEPIGAHKTERMHFHMAVLAA